MAEKQTHQFQAEVSQLLEIVIHSLYTHKEIFVRELISNAADAIEKVRFLQTSGETVRDPDLEAKILIQTNEEDRTLTFIDNGLGMTQDELLENLGTIARSGSKNFLTQFKELAQSGDASADLIGQFGVGFYSAFMVADKVTVVTQSWKDGEPACKWVCEGKGSFEIEETEAGSRGTKIIVHLKDTEGEYAKGPAIQEIIHKYSSFVPVPVELNGEKVNTVQAIWTRSKSEVTDEEYDEFYKFFSHASDEPRYRLHFMADAPLSIKSLLFVPKSNFEKFGWMRTEQEVHLYCRKVLIQSKAEGLLPDWCRFIKGVVDSEDLPLNISRETLQDHGLIQKLNKVLVKRFLKMLEEEAKKKPEDYLEFYKEFGNFLKEGVVQDFAHREQLSKLLRFESSMLEEGQMTSLADYVSRMKEGQEEIYFLMASNREAAKSSAYFEVFEEKGMEVLFLTESIDEFAMDNLREFDGKSLVAAEKAKLEIDNPSEDGLTAENAEMLKDWFKSQFNERIEEAEVSKRLKEFPAVVVDYDPMTTTSMRRVMKAMQRQDGVTIPDVKPKLEINPAHPVMVKLNSVRFSNEKLAKDVAEQVIDNAMLAAGMLDDPQAMVKRLNRLMGDVLKD